MSNWWQLDVKDVSKQLSSDLNKGLSAEQASRRLQEYGPNKLLEKPGRSPILIFLDQFRSFIIWVLIGAAIVSGFLKEWVDAFAIVGIVILNSILGFIQEHRAEKSLSALKKLSSPNSKVIRGGQHSVIPSANLVPGDLIELEAGDNIPADARIVYATPNCNASEASLTGESTPVAKTQLSLEEKDVPLADRANMVYMGTNLSAGKARAMVAATGMRTELGKIAGMIQDITRDQTPLHKKLEQFGRWIVYLCFVLVGLVFVLEYWRGGKILDVFLTAVSLAVAAIPEGLPAVVTITLSLGVQRMVKRHALIRKLQAVQTLGCVTLICSDKTGTLTKNEMTVQAIYADDILYQVTGIGYEPKGEFLADNKNIDDLQSQKLTGVLKCAVLCNGAQLVQENGVYKIVGDPTEGALLTAAAKLGIWKDELEKENLFIEEIPFDSERKKMTVVRRTAQGLIAYVKGAPDILLSDCIYVEKNDKTTELTAYERQKILEVNDNLANDAMRVMALAYRPLQGDADKYEAKAIERNLTFLGLAAMIDPPRQEVKQAIEKCQQAGVKTVMITGDHKNTAVAIAKELGFFTETSMVLTGEELDRLNDEDFAQRVDKTLVYARVSSEHKLRIVRAWRRRGDCVSMTGDGVNDAPAVKEADIGVAMGITGTDVTKEVSDMVVTDDNFASIVAAIEEGRGIYENIKKFIHFLLSCNAGEILVMLFSSLVGMPIPLLPIHILWVNLVTDGLPALALGVEPVEPDIMKLPPRPADEPIVTWPQVIVMLIQGAFIALCTLSAFCYVYYIDKKPLGDAQTAAFIVLSVSQLFHAFNCRSRTRSLFSIGLFTNIKLIHATLVSLLLAAGVVYVPAAQKIFRTYNLTVTEVVIIMIVSSLPLWGMELVKLINRKYRYGD